MEKASDGLALVFKRTWVQPRTFWLESCDQASCWSCVLRRLSSWSSSPVADPDRLCSGAITTRRTWGRAFRRRTTKTGHPRQAKQGQRGRVRRGGSRTGPADSTIPRGRVSQMNTASASLKSHPFLHIVRRSRDSASCFSLGPGPTGPSGPVKSFIPLEVVRTCRDPGGERTKTKLALFKLNRSQASEGAVATVMPVM